MYRKTLIDLSELDAHQVEGILKLAADIRQDPNRYYGVCDGKILATLFYEPSTRTQMSFQTAMMRLGGKTIGFDNPMNSSVAKGETIADTIRIISGYADVIAMRHPVEGAPRAASLYSSCPLINAGDGGHLHPSQTLTDLVTLNEEKGGLEGLHIGLCGDLLNGRTVHSLVKTLSNYRNTFTFISTPELGMPDYILKILDDKGIRYNFVSSLTEAIPELDVLYMTRIQKERFASEEQYRQQKNVYVLDKEKMDIAKKSLTVLHPLPRVDEITYEVDDDPRAAYFRQAACGVFARMALIMRLLEGDGCDPVLTGIRMPEHRCHNPRCITGKETYLTPSWRKSRSGVLLCEYCDAEYRD